MWNGLLAVKGFPKYIYVFFFFLPASSDSNKIHKILKPFRVVEVRDRRSSRRFGGRKMLQSKIVWLAHCSPAPQMHLGVSNLPQRYKHVPKVPTPIRGLFSATHRLPVSSESGGRQTAGVTKNWTGGLELQLKREFTSTAAWRWKGVVSAGALCRRTVHCGQGYEGGGCLERQLEMEADEPVRRWGEPVECPRVLVKAPYWSVSGTQRWCATYRLTQHLAF